MAADGAVGSEVSVEQRCARLRTRMQWILSQVEAGACERAATGERDVPGESPWVSREEVSSREEAHAHELSSVESRYTAHLDESRAAHEAERSLLVEEIEGQQTELVEQQAEMERIKRELEGLRGDVEASAASARRSALEAQRATQDAERASARHDAALAHARHDAATEAAPRLETCLAALREAHGALGAAVLLVASGEPRDELAHAQRLVSSALEGWEGGGTVPGTRPHPIRTPGEGSQHGWETPSAMLSPSTRGREMLSARAGMGQAASPFKASLTPLFRASHLFPPQPSNTSPCVHNFPIETSPWSTHRSFF